MSDLSLAVLTPILETWRVDLNRVAFVFERYKNKLDRAVDDVEIVWNALVAISVATDHKYLDWLTRRFLNHQSILNNSHDVSALLKQFHTHKQQLSDRDINHFGSLKSLKDALSKAKMKQSNKEKKRSFKRKLVEDGHMQRILQLGGLSMFKVSSPTAARFWAKGTKWCTSNKETYAHYAIEPLFIIQIRGEGKFQLHLSTELSPRIVK